jgi:hypothetical protein
VDCKCHGEPAYWQRDVRLTAGGYWRCAVKKRAQARLTDGERRDVKVQRQRDRYDADPIYRIGKLLSTNAVKRRKGIERRREALLSDREGENHGQVQNQR